MNLRQKNYFLPETEGAIISGAGKHSNDNYVLNEVPFRIIARKVILATGGRTYPQTGSEGDGYIIAGNLGHSINELSPYLLPVFSKDRDIILLAGVSIKEAGLKILAGKKVIAKNMGSILFTHKGLSGPCALSVGHEVYKLLNSKNKNVFSAHGSVPVDVLKSNPDYFDVSIDLAPGLSFEDFRNEISRAYNSNHKKELLTILNIILTNIPERLLDLILIRCKIIKNLKISNLSGLAI